MNKHLYRIIFSKTLQRFVVVSEIAMREGKAKHEGQHCHSTSLSQRPHWRLKPLTVGLYSLLGFFYLASAQADELQILADSTAPKNQQPIVLQTANGLPQVNIQTPNDKGLSHNKYQQFDVAPKGAILNNSRKNVQTEQGGWVQANPYLVGGEAKVILNEVNATKPSQLKGYIKVAGGKADVIIANPSGIHCEGCGIINAGRSTFTTGEVQIENGQVKGYRVEKGAVTVSGRGFDSSRQDYTDIIAKEVKVNAGIWANNLKVTTGQNQVSANNDTIQVIRAGEASQPVGYAVDVAKLGGMYANQIHLIGTENGLGVRNAGHIGAAAGEVKIDSQGRIVNTGKILAPMAINLTSKNGIENHGKIVNLQKDITLHTASDIQQDGSIVARKGNIHQVAQQDIRQHGESIAKGNITYQAPTVSASTSSLIVAGADTQESPTEEKRTLEPYSAQGKTLLITTTGKTSLQGKNIASGKIQVNSTTTNFDHSHTEAYTININATQGNIHANQANFVAQQDLTLNTPRLLSTQASSLTAKKITTTQHSLNTQHAVWEQLGKEDFRLDVADTLYNQGGTFKTQGDFFINAEGLDNRQGRLLTNGLLNLDIGKGKLDTTAGTLLSHQSLSIVSGELINDKGLIQSNQRITINTQGQRLSNQQTLTTTPEKGIIALDTLTITSGQLFNQQGRIVSHRQQQLDTHTINNQQGSISSQQHLSLNSQTLNNEKGKILAESTLTIKSKEINNNQGNIFSQDQGAITATTFTNHNGILQSSNQLHLKVTDLSQQAGLLSANDLRLVANTLVSNQQSNIVAKQLSLTADTFANQNSTLLAQQKVFIDVQQGIQNQQGTIASLGDVLTLNTHQSELNNTAGTLAVQNGTLTLQTNILDNKQGLLLAKTADIHAQQTIDNRNTLTQPIKGIIATDLIVETKHFDNQSGRITAFNTATLHTEDLQNTVGEMLFAQTGQINTQSLNNQAGKLVSLNAALNITTQTTLNNQQGLLNAADQVNLTTFGLSNQQGKLYAGNALTMAIQTDIHNQQGIIQSDGAMVLTATTLQNQTGTIKAKSQGNITAQTIHNAALPNHQSLIIGDLLTLTTQTLNNNGTKATSYIPTQGIQGRDIILNAQALNNQQGGIYSTHTLSITANDMLDNQQGELLALDSITLQHRGNLMVNNQAGLIQGNNAIQLAAKRLIDEGNIKAGKDLTLTLQDDFTLNNAFVVGQNLTLTTAGNFTNNVAQNINHHLMISAANIINQPTAELSAQNTHLISRTLTNRGLIDGRTTTIKSNTITNIGTGRIYGDHLALQASHLSNLEENHSAATIGARTRLDFGVDRLLNRYGSTIISLGSIHFGKTLDAQQHATGQANIVQNHNAVIEALGQITFNVNSIENLHQFVKMEIQETSRTPIFEYGFANEAPRYSKNTPGLTKVKRDDKGSFNKKVENLYALRLPDGRESESWREYNYIRTINESMLLSSPYAEAKILSGDKINVYQSHIKNYDSKMIAHTGIEFHQGTSIDNHATQGVIITTDKGKLTSFYNGRACAKKILGKCIDYYRTTKSNTVAYQDEKQQTKTFDLWDYVENSTETTVLSNTITQPTAVKNVHLSTIAITDGEITNHLTETALPKLNSQQIAITPEMDNALKNQIVTSGEVVRPLALPLVKTHLTTIQLPTASLYQINPEAPHGYLIETDPKFIDRNQWIGGDYMFNALRADPQHMLKRLGDGFYEQRLINEQINQLTGQRYLPGYTNDLEQYKALMDNGVKYAKQFNFSIGVGLTAQQMSELTTDMIWFVNKEVSLADGRKLTVLVPQVYLIARHSDVTTQGGLISANTIIGQTDNLENSGVIAGRDLTQLDTTQLKNRGVILGQSVNLSAKQQLVNLGGRIEAVERLLLSAGKQLEVSSTLTQSESDQGRFAHQTQDQLGVVKVTGKNGTLALYSDGNLTIKAAQIASQGTLTAIAGEALAINTHQVSNKEHYHADANNYYRLDQQGEEGSTLTAKENITIIGKQQAELRQATIQSTQGNIFIGSQGDITLTTGQHQEQINSSRKEVSSGLFNKITTLKKHTHETTEQKGSQLDGQQITLVSEQGDLRVTGSTIVADKNVNLQAQDIEITAAKNTRKEHDFYAEKKSGVMSSGISITLGTRKEATDTTNRQQIAQGSQIGSLQGDIQLIAHENYRQQGSRVTVGNGDVTIVAKKIDITAVEDKATTDHQHSFKQSGLTLGVNIPVVQAAQQVQQTIKTVKQVGDAKDNRINALTAINAAFDLANTADVVGNVADTLANQGIQGLTQNIGISIGYGKQKNEQTVHTETTTARPSKVNATGNVMLHTTADKDTSHIVVKGSEIVGQQGTTLATTGDLIIEAQQQTHQEQSHNQSSGWNAGVAINYSSNGVAFGITAGGNSGKGYGNGDETIWENSLIGNQHSQTTLISGKDLTIQGGQVIGQGVSVQANNLTITSLQDTTTYQGKHKQTSTQATVGYGASLSGNYTQSKLNADYASVNQQSGIFANDEGFNVHVHQHTDLQGGLVTSTELAEQQGKNRFITGTLNAEDIQNHSNYKGSAFGIGGSIAMNFASSLTEKGQAQSHKQATNKQEQPLYIDSQGNETTASHTEQGQANQRKLATGLSSLTGSTSVGIGSDKSTQTAITKAGIGTNHIVINDPDTQQEKTGLSIEQIKENVKTTLTTENAKKNNGSLVNHFDKEKVLKELNIQVKVTQDFRKNAFKTIDNYVLPKQAELRKQIKQAQTEEEKTELYKEIYKLQYQKRLLETVVGLVSGSPDLAITQGTLQLAATKMREETLANSRKFKGIIDAKTGQILRNDSYDSGYFDGIKLGGVRIDLNIICNSGMGTCTQNSDGSVTFDGNKNTTILDAIDPNQNKNAKNLYGPTGGFQSIHGGWYFSGKPLFIYNIGDISDNLVESYAGTHDLLGGQIWGWYDQQGNTSEKNFIQDISSNITTAIGIPVATPFAMADLMSSDFVETLFKLGGN
ncbi:hemagglutinin repeat-containing protein [Gallibacterium melopsittaci]|uniref:Hemagglutinin repeat-containing protein n=1 Tax=Gallibacterium melopsittaci TaxID=516063 RepID=A0ABV6HU96_9PAST